MNIAAEGLELDRGTLDEGVIWRPRLDAQSARWRDLAFALSRDHFGPAAAQIDQAQRYPHEHVEKLRETGIASMLLPQAFGGGGASLTSYIAVVEQVAQACASTSGIVATLQLGAAPLLLITDEGLKGRLLRAIVERGEMISFGLSERGAGSDPANMATMATPEIKEGRPGWRIRGQKCWIGGGSVCAHYVIFAQTEAGSGKRGIAAFLVQASAEGVDDSVLEDKMGMRGTCTATITLDTWVAQDAVLAPPGKGLALALAALDVGRVGVAAQSCGMALVAFRTACEHAARRETFGQRLIDHQALGFRLAALASRLSSVRLMTYEAAAAYDRGASISVIAAQAKLLASEMAHDMVDDCLQMLGGAGYVKPHPIERLYRDQRVTEIYEGTSEIQQLLIARTLRQHAMRRVGLEKAA